jgi:Right handed beta helix region
LSPSPYSYAYDRPQPPRALRTRWLRRFGARCVPIVCITFVLSACGLTGGSSSTGVSNALADGHGGRTFYVAPWGRDSNHGMNPRHPWRTVTRVDKARLRPGDRVLFAAGRSFSDNTLMPGWGYMASGTAASPITFGTWGRGRAQLTQGVWLGTYAGYPTGPSHLVFKDLALGPRQGFQGTGDYITLTNLRIGHLRAPYSHGEVGIETEGSHWRITNNHIDYTGDSGMLLGYKSNGSGDPPGGYDYLVANNLITFTGLDGSLGYAAHGIYLKVAGATIIHNTISNFHDDGVSARYRDAQIIGNYLAHGAIGIAWYQYDTVAGTSHFEHNTISNTHEAGIFVCGVAESCAQPIENFVIRRNRLRHNIGPRMNLQSTRGRYDVGSNP